jgi:hypothetical protein
MLARSQPGREAIQIQLRCFMAIPNASRPAASAARAPSPAPHTAVGMRSTHIRRLFFERKTGLSDDTMSPATEMTTVEILALPCSG